MKTSLSLTGLAQLVEHGPFKPVAAGSSPAIGILACVFYRFSSVGRAWAF